MSGVKGMNAGEKHCRYIHGETHTRLHKIWESMIARCEYDKLPYYARYGGRGIRVCEEWHEYVVFREWATKNGYNDNLTIDRIDNERGYYPANCRWSTVKAHLAHGGEIDECEEDFIAITWYALSLINRQEAEIERLETENKNLLKKLCKKSQTASKAVRKLIRSEAIKEFAERLKGNIRMNCFCEKYVFEKDIDSLVKEMVGEHEIS